MKDNAGGNSRRIQQLAWMLSDISNVSLDYARDLIISTETGKAVQENDRTVLYEQQTANLAEIAGELERREPYHKIASMLTMEKIAEAGRRLRAYENENKRAETAVKLTMHKNTELKEILQKQTAVKRKSVLAIKKQNQMNVRRVEHADQLKGSK